MAASVTITEEIHWATTPFTTRSRITSLESDVPVDLSHGLAAGVTVTEVRCVTVVAPLDGSAVGFRWHKENDSTTNNTVRIVFTAAPGCALTGAEVDVYCSSEACASDS